MEFKAMDPCLYEAAASGNVGYLRRITDVEVLNDLLLQKTPKENNVLHIAAEFKQVNFFENVPRESPLFWVTNKKGDTPLHVAAMVGCSEVVEFLINHAKTKQQETDVESRAANGEAYKELLRTPNLELDTALHVAVRYGRDQVTKLLMQADPELCCLTNTANESTLFLATTNGFPSIVNYILSESQLSPSFQGINGVTALHVAVTRKPKTFKGIVETMASKHPNIIRQVDTLGWTPLHYAAFKGNLEATQVLMRHDSCASYILDKSGMSSLHVAAYAGHTKVMGELVRCRPDTCDLRNAKGQTALHAAVLGDQSSVVKYILKTPKFGGLINEADNDGNTPLHLAAFYKKQPIIRILTGDRRVDKAAINKEFSKAVDFYFGDDTGQGCFGIAFSNWLGHSIGVPYFQQVCRDFVKLDSQENDTSHRTQRDIEGNREELQAYLDEDKRFDTNLVVAMLIATVAFAAAFTMPGGFKSNGMAMLHGKALFHVFVLCDALSFFSSILVVFNHFLVKARSRSQALLVPSSTLIQCSILVMMIGFASGMVVVLPKYSPLGILVFICSLFCYEIIGRIRVQYPKIWHQRAFGIWFHSRTI